MKENSAKKYIILKWLGGILLFLILILGAASLYISAKWKPLLTEKIKSAVYNGSHHLYKIDFKNIHLNLLLGNAALDNVALLPDTAVFNELKKTKQVPTHLFRIELSKLQLNSIGVLTAWFKKKIDIKAIVLDRPSIHIIYNKVAKKPDTAKDDRTLYQQISKTLKSIHISGIRIVNADVDYISGATQKTLNSVKHLNINIKDVLIDSLSQFDTTRFYYTKDVSFELTGYKSVTKDKMYTMKADSVSGSATGRTILVKGFKVIPMYPDLTFSRKYKHQKDRYDLDFDQIRFADVDFLRLNNEGSLHAGAITIGPAKVAIFMNRELPPPTFDKGRNYPHIALKRLPMETIVDTLKIKDVNVAYTEYNPIAQKRGTVNIDHLYGKILNVTNDSAQLSKSNHAIANLKAKIIKSADINVNINFNLSAKNGAFSYSGNVGSLNMTALNPLAESLGLVEIESGRIQKADFEVNANLKGSTGTMRLYYTGLKVKLLKEGENGAPAKKKGFLSFLANNLVIKDSNPDKDKPLRVGKISFERTPAASFFNLLWKSISVGMRETIGIGMVPVKSPEEAHIKVKEKKAERVQKTEQKKNKN